MTEPKSSPEQAPGHYGPGYGEQVPANAPPQPAPLTDDDETRSGEPALDEGAADPAEAAGSTTIGDDGAPVVFTPDDVGARPPDHPPTGNAPESEKAGLIFERS
jgi:hypothetical protein